MIILLPQWLLSLALLVAAATVTTAAEDPAAPPPEPTNNLLHIPNSREHRVHHHYDVVVYGGTPGGVAAALAVAHHNNNNNNKTVLLVEPTGHVGGMASEGGIGLRDGAKTDVLRQDPRDTQYQWGLLNAQHYQWDPDDSTPHMDDGNNIQPIWQPDNWVGEQSFLKLLRDANIEVWFDSPLAEGSEYIQHVQSQADDRANSDNFPEAGRVITKIAVERAHSNTKSNNTTASPAKLTWVTAKYFIDASYEGELVTTLSDIVSYTYGREATSTYQETRGGITNASAAQFHVDVDVLASHHNAIHTNPPQLVKYVDALAPDPRQTAGGADRNVMAYSYRACLTRNTSNAAPITPPPGYDPIDFELARRLVQAELNANRTLSSPWGNLVFRGYNQIRLPGGNPKAMKYDACCGGSAVGIDAPGLGIDYPTATRQERVKIAADHRYYVQGLLWFWVSDPVIPVQVRRTHQKYGLCKDEWTDNGHFPRQLYVREAIRLVGDQVFTQNDRTTGCKHNSIAVGSWGLDNHVMQRVAVWSKKTKVEENLRDEAGESDDGDDNDAIMSDRRRKGRHRRHSRKLVAFNEGGSSYNRGGTAPFEIPYSVLLPKRNEVTNLAVVNCPSVSHVAFGAIREEPTLWRLGTAAGTAAALAVDAQTRNEREGSSTKYSKHAHVPLHDVNVAEVQLSLLEQGNIIHWPPSEFCSTSEVR